MVATLSAYMQNPTRNEPELSSASGLDRNKKIKMNEKWKLDQRGRYLHGNQGSEFGRQLQSQPQRHPQQQQQIATASEEENIVIVEASCSENILGPANSSWRSSINPQLATGDINGARRECGSVDVINENTFRYLPNFTTSNSSNSPFVPPALNGYLKAGSNVPYMPLTGSLRGERWNITENIPQWNILADYVRAINSQAWLNTIYASVGLNPTGLQMANCSNLLSNLSDYVQHSNIQNIQQQIQQQNSLRMQAIAALAQQQRQFGMEVETVPPQWVSPPPPSTASFTPSEDPRALQSPLNETLPSSISHGSMNQTLIGTRSVETGYVSTNIMESEESTGQMVTSQKAAELFNLLEGDQYLRNNLPGLTDGERLSVLSLASIAGWEE